jgi:hypothetical protein
VTVLRIADNEFFALLTPAGAFQTLPFNYFSVALYFGIGIQAATAVLFEIAILARLRHPVGRTA